MHLQTLKAVKQQHYPISDPLEEAMDRARYKCQIFHMVSIRCDSLYSDVAIYGKGMARGNPYVVFAKPLESGNVECIVYVFSDMAHRESFLNENQLYNKLYKLTKERNVL